MIEEIDFNRVVNFLEGPGVRNWQFRDSGIKLINIRNLVNDQLELSNTNNHLDVKEVNQKYSHFLLEEGDFVMASSGVTWGKLAEVREEHLPLCLNTSIIKLKPKDERLEKRFLWHFIKSSKFRRQIDRLITGSAQPNFGPSHLHKILIPLPPLDQQKKIVAILDAADAYRQKTKALIEKYDELTQSLFLDMFGDPLTNPKEWKKEILNNLCSKISVGFVGTCEPFYCSQEEGVPMLRTGNLGEGFLKFDNLKYVSHEFHEKQKKSQLFEGDLLIARHGDNGKAVLYNGEFNNANCLNIVILRTGEKLISLFAQYLLNNDNTRKQIATRTGGATQKVVNTKEIQKLNIIVPDIIFQDQFAKRVQVIEEQKAQAEASLAGAEDLFNSLLQRAFKGELTS